MRAILRLSAAIFERGAVDKRGQRNKETAHVESGAVSLRLLHFATSAASVRSGCRVLSAFGAVGLRVGGVGVSTPVRNVRALLDNT